jgi:hypothetical protein
VSKSHDPLRPSVRPAARWPHLDLPFIGHVALGNGTQWQFMLGWCEDSSKLHVAILGKCYADYAGPVHPADVVEHFKQIPLRDATNVADLINAQFGHDTNFGSYHTECCQEEEA